MYVEFDVSTSSLKQTKDVWAAIPGPDSMYSKNNIRKGLPPYEFSPTTNIVKKGKNNMLEKLIEVINNNKKQ